MKTVRKSIPTHSQSIPAFRRWLGYVLLVCFLNTIVFPHIPGAIKGWQTCASESTNSHSLTEVILEDYLEIQDLTPVSTGEDIEDVFKTTDDLDLIDHEGLIVNFARFSKKKTIYSPVRLLPFHTFYSSSTPPPEC